jgi:hypothetical protein
VSANELLVLTWAGTGTEINKIFPGRLQTLVGTLVPTRSSKRTLRRVESFHRIGSQNVFREVLSVMLEGMR